MAFSSPNMFGGNNTGFGGFGQPQASTFSWNQQPQSQLPPPPPLPSTTSTEKGQIITCLNESKNVQMAILQELKAMHTKLDVSPSKPYQDMFGKPMHQGVFCNVCSRSNITGARFKCLFCKDFDMCEECEAKTQPMHDITHMFIKIKDTTAFLNKMAMKPTLFNA